MARNFQTYPVSNHGVRDERYQISLEYCGYEYPMFTARFCDDELIGRDSTTAGFIWDMLDLNAVDWGALAAHHAPVGADA